jgi:hypothetical protein
MSAKLKIFFKICIHFIFMYTTSFILRDLLLHVAKEFGNRYSSSSNLKFNILMNWLDKVEIYFGVVILATTISLIIYLIKIDLGPKIIKVLIFFVYIILLISQIYVPII